MTAPDAADSAAPGLPTPPPTNVARSTAVMAAGTLASRVLGMVRTVLLAAAIGVTASISADAYSVANKLPNVMFAVLAAGVLNAALVPQIVKAFQENRERTVHRILTLGGVGILGVTAILTLTAGFWVQVYSKDWSAEQTALATAFAFWCIPQLLFYGLYTLFGQVLNARGQYGPFMWAPVANNVVAIAGLVAYLVIFGSDPADGTASVTAIVDRWDTPRILLIAAVATLGIAVQALVLIPFMVRGGYRWKWVWRGPKGELGTAAKVATWALGAVVIEQVGVALVTRVASAAQDASDAVGADPSIAGTAAYDYALGFYLLPHSIVSISLMTVLFVQMAQHAAAGRLDRLRAVMSEGVRIVGVFTMFAGAVLAVAAPYLMRSFLWTQSGESVDAVAWVLRFMALGLVPLGASVLVKQAYFALEDGRTVFLIHIPMTIAWLVVAYAAQAALDPVWWVRGIALGLAATNLVAVVLRLWGLNRRLGGVDTRRILVTHAKAGVAALLAAGVGLAIVAVAPRSWENPGTDAVVTSVAVSVGIAAAMFVAYALAARALRLEEATAVARTVARRIRRVP